MEQENISDLIFGIHPILEGLKAGKSFDKILLLETLRTEQAKEIVQYCKDLKISINRVPEQKLNRVTRKNHQGVIGFISPIEFQELEDVIANVYEKGESPLILLLDRVSDVRNFGAILRTAECAGVHAVVIPKKGAAQINGETIKTSAGAIFNIPICKVAGIDSALRYLKESGILLVGCTEKTDRIYDTVDYTGPVGIVMGSEEGGIALSNLKVCDFHAKLPMLGKTESLNVSVAAGVIIYEAVKQRLKK